MLLAAMLDKYLSRPGALETFLDRIAKAVKAPSELSYRNFVWSVRAGRRAIPEAATEKWARCLGILPGGTEWEAFIHLAAASRAYGKTNGRAYLAKIEEENGELRTQLEAAREEALRLRSELTRLAAEEDLGDEGPAFG
jgi:hypothetical protein